MSRRQAARVQEEAIPEELMANIPVVAGRSETEESTTFAIEHEEVIFASAGEDDAIPLEAGAGDGAEAPPAGVAADGTPLSQGAAIAAQLRYDLGEAFARELDRAEQAVAAAMADMEGRLAQAEAEMAALRAEVERERAAREGAEGRLKAFKELALR